jgi:hypothetical protein
VNRFTRSLREALTSAAEQLPVDLVGFGGGCRVLDGIDPDPPPSGAVGAPRDHVDHVECAHSARAYIPIVVTSGTWTPEVRRIWC